jgi:hypothetical protein
VTLPASRLASDPVAVDLGGPEHELVVSVADELVAAPGPLVAGTVQLLLLAIVVFSRRSSPN